MATKYWEQVNAREFLAYKGTKRTGPHKFTKQILHWPYCAECGLVRLKNDASRKASKAKCVWEE